MRNRRLVILEQKNNKDMWTNEISTEATCNSWRKTYCTILKILERMGKQRKHTGCSNLPTNRRTAEHTVDSGSGSKSTRKNWIVWFHGRWRNVRKHPKSTIAWTWQIIQLPDINNNSLENRAELINFSNIPLNHQPCTVL